MHDGHIGLEKQLPLVKYTLISHTPIKDRSFYLFNLPGLQQTGVSLMRTGSCFLILELIALAQQRNFFTPPRWTDMTQFHENVFELSFGCALRKQTCRIVQHERASQLSVLRFPGTVSHN